MTSMEEDRIRTDMTSSGVARDGLEIAVVGRVDGKDDKDTGKDEGKVTFVKFLGVEGAPSSGVPRASRRSSEIWDAPAGPAQTCKWPGISRNRPK
jgi:hypothetical protein